MGETWRRLLLSLPACLFVCLFGVLRPADYDESSQDDPHCLRKTTNISLNVCQRNKDEPCSQEDKIGRRWKRVSHVLPIYRNQVKKKEYNRITSTFTKI